MVAPIRVVVVDDSLLYRKVVRDSLATIPNVEVVGTAANGVSAIERIETLKPDLVTLDLEMPEMDGLGVLKWMREKRVSTKAVMLSAVTMEGASATMKALQEGAFDFVCKPSGGDKLQNQTELQEALKQRIQTLEFLRSNPSPTTTVRRLRPTLPTPEPAVVATPTSRMTPRPNGDTPVLRPGVHVVGIGISTGGPDALRVMLPMLPENFPVPILIVQHMPPMFTNSLAGSLDRLCKLRVHEAEDCQPIKAGEILIAPGGRQMKVIRTQAGPCVRITDDPQVQNCRPSVDYLFRSMIDVYGRNMLGVIMTGMGQDGSDELKRLHDMGGTTIAQDAGSCVVFGMPRKPVEEGFADIVVPLNEIAGQLSSLAAGRSG